MTVQVLQTPSVGIQYPMEIYIAGTLRVQVGWPFFRKTATLIEICHSVAVWFKQELRVSTVTTGLTLPVNMDQMDQVTVDQELEMLMSELEEE